MWCMPICHRHHPVYRLLLPLSRLSETDRVGIFNLSARSKGGPFRHQRVCEPTSTHRRFGKYGRDLVLQRLRLHVVCGKFGQTPG